MTSQKKRARITRGKDGLWRVKWAKTGKVEVINAETLSLHGQMLRVGVEPVPHRIEIFPSKRKRHLDVVTELDLESYLLGVLPSEMPASWPLEALKAQAVAARSFVLRSSAERRHRHFDVDSTVLDQVYKFIHEVKEQPKWRARVVRAIKETEGEVLKDANGRTIKAFYSADCGCRTEDPRYVWGGDDPHRSIKDPTCSERETKTWTFQLSRDEVRKRLIEEFDLPKGTSLRTVHLGQRTPSGRVSTVLAALDVDGNPRSYRLRTQEFRRIFGFKRIRSADFGLRWLGSKLQINGRGLGHGVGLCQTGARSMAENGNSYQEILKLFYPHAKLGRRASET